MIYNNFTDVTWRNLINVVMDHYVEMPMLASRYIYFLIRTNFGMHPSTWPRDIDLSRSRVKLKWYYLRDRLGLYIYVIYSILDLWSWVTGWRSWPNIATVCHWKHTYDLLDSRSMLVYDLDLDHVILFWPFKVTKSNWNVITWWTYKNLYSTIHRTCNTQILGKP